MILAMAQAEGPAGKLVGVSDTAEKQSHGGGTLFFIISKVEAVDAFIIALCMALLGLASWVMVTKSRYIGAAQRGNTAFLKRFRRMSLIEEFVSLRDSLQHGRPDAAGMRHSPLAHLFEAGIEELELRHKAGEPRKPLSAEAVESLRAAVDAVQVEENQKLDKWMVLLTIAISGGPFIGLLGTVMGVMNTFGGVAIAGDVNVNAIAPGIAAALLATIAGLACAIPSLFGYNYLNSQISSLADEMRVFVDRLITRLAEMQHDAAPSPLPLAAE